jgi:8-oxo-dGTP diphosphatase
LKCQNLGSTIEHSWNKEEKRRVELPYTICFCCYQQQVLMLYRALPPNAQLWNGLGGKIESGETPLVSVQREVQEEAGIDLGEATSLHFSGITTWELSSRNAVKGMYVFIAHLSAQQAERIDTLDTPEGVIAWKPLAWVCDLSNREVVDNIPRFLPLMLEDRTPYEYFEPYENEYSSTETLRQLVIRPLPASIELSECQGW